MVNITAQASAFTSGNESTTTTVPNSNILWGVMAAAVVGATLADWQKKREEEAAAKAIAARAEFLESIRNRGEMNDNRILSYSERAKAYQASLDNYKSSLIKNGYSAKEASGLKSKAVLGGSIPSVSPRAIYSPSITGSRPNMPKGLSPQAQAAEKQYRETYNEHMYDKMEQFEELDDAKWTASQAVMAQREKEKQNAVSAASAGNVKPLFTLTNNILIENELGSYGIHTLGVDEQHQQLLKQAANIYGNYYLPYIGNNVSASQSFVLSHGSFLVVVDKNANVKDEFNPNANCKTQNNSFLSDQLISQLNLSINMDREDRYPYLGSYQRDDGTNIHLPTEQRQLIVCREQPDFYNLMHEIVHVFDNHYLNVTRGEYHLADYLPPLSVGDLEMRFTEKGGLRTPFGFENGGRPPIRQNTGGDNLFEELADTLMNAALDGNPDHPKFGFTDNPAGDARREDIQNLLEQVWKPNMQTYFDSMSNLLK